MKKSHLVILFQLVFFSGCASTYKTPSDVPTTPFFGSFYTQEELSQWWKDEYSFAKNISGKPFENSVVFVAFVDGQEVSNAARPVYVSSGKHVLGIMITDRVSKLIVDFQADIDVSIRYAVKFKMKGIENTQTAEVWIENHDTGEKLSDVKEAAMLPATFEPQVIPIIL